MSSCSEATGASDAYVSASGLFTSPATGDLTLHGVTKRITMPLQVRMNPDGRIELVGSLKFPMADFGIDPPNVAGFVTVSSDATLEIQLFLGP